MYCEKCGKPVSETAFYCQWCGNELVVLRTAEIEVFYEVKSGGSEKK